jgi:hypothetical protein
MADPRVKNRLDAILPAINSESKLALICAFGNRPSVYLTLPEISEALEASATPRVRNSPTLQSGNITGHIRSGFRHIIQKDRKKYNHRWMNSYRLDPYYAQFTFPLAHHWSASVSQYGESLATIFNTQNHSNSEPSDLLTLSLLLHIDVVGAPVSLSLLRASSKKSRAFITNKHNLETTTSHLHDFVDYGLIVAPRYEFPQHSSYHKVYVLSSLYELMEAGAIQRALPIWGGSRARSVIRYLQEQVRPVTIDEVSAEFPDVGQRLIANMLPSFAVLGVVDALQIPDAVSYGPLTEKGKHFVDTFIHPLYDILEHKQPALQSPTRKNIEDAVLLYERFRKK